MYGLAAINAAHGWLITVVGIGIVFTGLVILSTFIANLERLLKLWDNRHQLLPKKSFTAIVEKAPGPAAAGAMPEEAPACGVVTVTLSEKEYEVFDYFQLITQRLGEPFSLMRLLEHAEHRGIAMAHHHLDNFLKMQLIVEGKEEWRGFYRWQKDLRVVSTKDRPT